MRNFEITASDGSNHKILFYLTHDTNSANNSQKFRKKPLLVFPHGGPNHRDSWGYDGAVQLLASRGFLVLQPQYRGSTGFGTAFMQAGMHGQCVEGMQTDIADCVRYCVEELQSADPNRICILGGSFGGYFALCGLAEMKIQPSEQLPYRCAVSICGLSAIGAANDAPAFRNDPLIKKFFRKLYGEKLSSDRRLAERASPLFRTEHMRGKGLLLVQGANDPRVPPAHAEKMVKALGGGATDVNDDSMVEYILFEDEGHGISKEKNILEMWTRIDRFLRKHMSIDKN